jgi:hypothetical protein
MFVFAKIFASIFAKIFVIFVYFRMIFSRKTKINFRENTKKKIFVSTLCGIKGFKFIDFILLEMFTPLTSFPDSEQLWIRIQFAKTFLQVLFSAEFLLHCGLCSSSGPTISCQISICHFFQPTLRDLKETVSRDFRPSVFSSIVYPQAPD